MRYYSYIRENIYTKGKIFVLYTENFQKKQKERPVTKTILFVTGLYSLYSYVPTETKAVLQKKFRNFLKSINPHKKRLSAYITVRFTLKSGPKRGGISAGIPPLFQQASGTGFPVLIR
jgi:hypothetical protein